MPRLRAFSFALVAALAACSSHASHGSSTTTTVAPGRPAITATTLSGAAIAAGRVAAKDVGIRSCAADRAHHVEVKGSAHNPTSGRVNYNISIAISGRPGTPEYATVASATRVAPGWTAQWDVATTAPFASGMRCSVTRVSRRPA